MDRFGSELLYGTVLGNVIASSIGHFEVVRNTGSKLDLQNSPRALSIKQNSGLKSRKFQVPNGTVHSGCTDSTQATARLVIRDL